MTSTSTLTEINDYTGYTNGELFADEEQVRTYFTPDEQRLMFGDDAITDAYLLGAWADRVISERSHMVARS